MEVAKSTPALPGTYLKRTGLVVGILATTAGLIFPSMGISVNRVIMLAEGRVISQLTTPGYVLKAMTATGVAFSASGFVVEMRNS